MWLLQIAQNRYEKKSVNKSESKRAIVTIFEHMWKSAQNGYEKSVNK